MMARVVGIDEAPQRRLAAGLAVLRVFFGLLFAANGAAKLLPGSWSTPAGYLIGSESALVTLRAELAGHPIAAYRALMELFVEHWDVAGIGLGVFELSIGVLLVVGLAARWAALLGALFALNLHLLTLFSGHWLFEYALLWLPLIVLAWVDAGRWHGLDARRARSVAAHDSG